MRFHDLEDAKQIRPSGEPVSGRLGFVHVLIEERFLLGEDHSDAFFYRVVDYQAMDVERNCATKTVSALHRLSLNGRIPPSVEEDNLGCSLEIQPNAARLDRDEECPRTWLAF